MKDAYGCHLKVKMQAIGDEFVAVTELAIGQTMEKVPIAIIRGYNWILYEGGLQNI
jgi:F420-0:gamma-glutamyl ligase